MEGEKRNGRIVPFLCCSGTSSWCSLEMSAFCRQRQCCQQSSVGLAEVKSLWLPAPPWHTWSETVDQPLFACELPTALAEKPLLLVGVTAGLSDCLSAS